VDLQYKMNKHIMLKNIKNKKLSGFTLIELLIVIAIIGILASIVLVRLSTVRTRAKDADFKSLASSLNSAIMMCCNSGGTIQTNISGAVCSPAFAGQNYPGPKKLGNIDVSTGSNSNCNGAQNYQVTITPGTDNHGNCNNIVINQTGIIAYNGC